MAEQTEVRFSTTQTTEQKPETQKETTTQTPEKPERPAWLPENFESPEALVKSYGELQKRLSKAAPAKETTEEALDYAALSAEFTQSGKLSDETVKAFEKRGIPREMVETHVEGLKALAAARRNELAEVVGSAETLDETLRWAGKNLEDSEIEGYNALLAAGNLTAAKVLLKDFAQRYQDANGTDGKSATATAGNGKGTGGTAAYASAAEMVADMRKPEYQNDPAFREKVRARVALSNF